MLQGCPKFVLQSSVWQARQVDVNNRLWHNVVQQALAVYKLKHPHVKSGWANISSRLPKNQLLKACIRLLNAGQLSSDIQIKGCSKAEICSSKYRQPEDLPPGQKCLFCSRLHNSVEEPVNGRKSPLATVLHVPIKRLSVLMQPCIALILAYGLRRRQVGNDGLGFLDLDGLLLLLRQSI